MHVATHLGLVHKGELHLADALNAVAEKHRDEPDIPTTCAILAAWSREHAHALQPLLKRYGEQPVVAPLVLHTVLFKGVRVGAHGLLRDLQDLALLATDVHSNWTVLSQAAKAIRDVELQTACSELSGQTLRQLDWLKERIADAAPQALIAET